MQVVIGHDSHGREVVLREEWSPPEYDIKGSWHWRVWVDVDGEAHPITRRKLDYRVFWSQPQKRPGGLSDERVEQKVAEMLRVPGWREVKRFWDRWIMATINGKVCEVRYLLVETDIGFVPLDQRIE